jgi:hypothetical protein
LIAVALHRIYNIVYRTINEVMAQDEIEREVSTPPVTPEEIVEAPVESSSINKIEKMSETLWRAFENRFKLK